MIRVYLVEDHPLMRSTLRWFLERDPNVAVCGEAADAPTALDDIQHEKPDLVLVDVALPGMSGIELVRELRRTNPGLAMAILSGHGERSHVEEALAAGAAAYILKGNGAELFEAIPAVLRGECYLSPGLGFPRDSAQA